MSEYIRVLAYVCIAMYLHMQFRPKIYKVEDEIGRAV